MSGNRVYFLLAILYVLTIYGTSGWMRHLSTLARQIFGKDLGMVMTTGLILILVAILAVIHRYCHPRRILPYIPVLIGYGLALFWLSIPEERFHLLQYGILSVLCSQALPERIQGARRHLLAIMLVCLAGIGDELIQWLRPNRVGDLRDVVINTVAAVLAQSLIAVSSLSDPAPKPTAAVEQ